MVNEAGSFSVWPRSHKLALKQDKYSSKNYQTLAANPHWRNLLQKAKVSSKLVDCRKGSVMLFKAGKMLHGSPPGKAAVRVATYAMFDKRKP